MSGTALGRKRAVLPRTAPRSANVAFPTLCKACGLPEPEAEYRFEPSRRWRFDWAFREQRIAVEQEGAVWVNGRHTRGAGVIKDMEKYNHAAVLGWRVLRATPQQIASGDILPTLLAAFRATA